MVNITVDVGCKHYSKSCSGLESPPTISCYSILDDDNYHNHQPTIQAIATINSYQ